MIASAQPLATAFKDISSEDDFSYALRDFIDRFMETPSLDLLSSEPALLAPIINDRGVADAWLAATAVYLCQKFSLTPPLWVSKPARFLEKPWFAAKTPNLKAILLQESPAAFRVRNLFISGNALSRA